MWLPVIKQKRKHSSFFSLHVQITHILSPYVSSIFYSASCDGKYFATSVLWVGTALYHSPVPEFVTLWFHYKNGTWPFSATSSLQIFNKTLSVWLLSPLSGCRVCVFNLSCSNHYFVSLQSIYVSCEILNMSFLI